MNIHLVEEQENVTMKKRVRCKIKLQKVVNTLDM